jgi:hypothetical protein
MIIIKEVKPYIGISFIEELEKLESIAKYFSAEIGPHKNFFIGYKLKVLITWFVLIFLWYNIIRVLLCLLLIDNEFNDYHIYFGDLAFVYAPQKYRLYINLTILTWTVNAAVMYTIIRWDIISGKSSFIKDWLNCFDKLWRESTSTDFKHKTKNKVKVELVKLINFL